MRVLSWLAKLSFTAFVISLVIGVTAGLGTRFGLWDFQVGLLKIFPWCLYIGIAAFVLGLLWAIWAAIANRGVAARYGVIGLIGSIVVLATPLYGIYMAKTSPAIHDITTDTEHPPEYEGTLKAKGPDGKEATTTALQKKYYPDIRAQAELTSAQKLFDRAVRSAKSMGWNLVAIVPDQGRIEATSTTLWFGFTDDIVIRVKPAGMGARLDIRSKSRVGTSDLGKNAARIRSYIKTLRSTY